MSRIYEIIGYTEARHVDIDDTLAAVGDDVLAVYYDPEQLWRLVAPATTDYREHPTRKFTVVGDVDTNRANIGDIAQAIKDECIAVKRFNGKHTVCAPRDDNTTTEDYNE
jgi:hypothetical protein